MCISKSFVICVFSLLSIISQAQKKPSGLLFPASDTAFSYSGRIERIDSSIRFSYTGVSIQARFTGNRCKVLLSDTGKTGWHNWYNVWIDDQPLQVIDIGTKDGFDLTLKKKVIHHLHIFKRTEGFVGVAEFKGLILEPHATLLPLPLDSSKKIEFIGNSITCGYGNEGTEPTCHFSPKTENGYMSYSAITSRLLNVKYTAIAYSGKGLVKNYDVGDTVTMPMLYKHTMHSLASPLWNFTSWVPDVVVINLGTNDFARSTPDSALFVSHYVQFLQRIRTFYPKAHLFCIEGCMTRDDWPKGIASFTLVMRYIEAAVKEANLQDERVYAYFPTSLQEGEMGCDWHPKVIRHQKMAEELSAFIKSKTGW